MTAARETLRRLEACPEAVDWVGDRAPETAWQECLRGDWLLWYASQLAVDRRQLVRAACACARLVLHLVREGEERPRLAIDAAGRWADDPTEENRMAARDAGDAADTAAGDAADTAAYTAGVAAYSAGAAGVAAWVAGDAGVAAYAAAYSAGAAAGGRDGGRAAAWDAACSTRPARAARMRMHRQCADAVRAVIPFPGLPV